MKVQEYYFEIPESASSEVIVWLPYPESRPKEEYGECLVTWESVETDEYLTTSVWWDNGQFYFDDIDQAPFDDVIAWAEMPKGYKENK